MSDMSQYTEVRCYDKGDGREPATYTAVLKVGAQSFQVGVPLPLDEAEWMRQQLTAALERIVRERRFEAVSVWTPAIAPRSYLIYRLVPTQPWDVYAAESNYTPGGEFAAWRGASYDEATKECKRMNAERNGP